MTVHSVHNQNHCFILAMFQLLLGSTLYGFHSDFSCFICESLRRGTRVARWGFCRQLFKSWCWWSWRETDALPKTHQDVLTWPHTAPTKKKHIRHSRFQDAQTLSSNQRDCIFTTGHLGPIPSDLKLHLHGQGLNATRQLASWQRCTWMELAPGMSATLRFVNHSSGFKK